MEEIKVGEYVRTENGEIHKVLEVEKGSIKIKSDYKEWIGLCCIVKHSFNIIDLIEVGDYVNGKLVNDIEKFEDGTIYIKFSEHDYISDIAVEKIKTILTKEQYKANCYEVK